jgi:hypothetical protein
MMTKDRFQIRKINHNLLDELNRLLILPYKTPKSLGFEFVKKPCLLLKTSK